VLDAGNPGFPLKTVPPKARLSLIILRLRRDGVWIPHPPIAVEGRQVWNDNK